MDERAADPAAKRVPGGGTGLLVKRIKRIGYKLAKDGMSREPVVVEEDLFDAPLLRVFLAIAKQAAQDLGQWGTQPEPADSMPGEMRIEIIDRRDQVARFND